MRWLWIGLLGWCAGAYAFIPGDDWAIILRLEAQLKQLQQQTQDLSNANQLSEKIRQGQIGHYGYGGLLNGDQDFQQRNWSPGSWKNALQGLSGGNNARYQELYREYKNQHPTLSQSSYQQGTNAKRAATYQQQVSGNRAAAVNANYAFDSIKQHLADIHQLSEEIDKAGNSKAAIDLNSRLLTEIAYVQVQSLKMQALLNEQLAQQGAATVSDQSDAASFNQSP